MQPRQLLLVDYGSAILHPVFSPDGKYLLFTLQRHDDTYDTRLVDVATRANGLLNETVILAEWRPSAGGSGDTTPVPTLPANLTRKVKLPHLTR
jgi:Tol biopolymer transport system component